jgi:hypothetical protein
VYTEQEPESKMGVPTDVSTVSARMKRSISLRGRILQLLLLGLCCCLVCSLIVFCPFVFRAWWGFSLCGTLVIYLALRPRLGKIVFSAFSAAGLFVLYCFRGGVLYGPIEQRVVSLAGFAGLGCLATLALDSVVADPGVDRAEALKSLSSCLALPAAVVLIDFVLLRPETGPSLDTLLLASDGALGLQPSFLIARLVQRASVALRFFRFVYNALPLAIAIAYAVVGTGSRRALALSLIIAGVLGRPLHYLVPAAGPAYAFASVFPAKVPALAWGSIRPVELEHVFLNCVPSLHIGWALLIYWRVEHVSRSAMVVAGVFLGGTAVATLALGEHYLVDLVVAVPYSLMITALCDGRIRTCWDHWRTAAAVLGSSLFMVWMVLLRFGILLSIPPYVGWLAIAVTLMLSVAFERQLAVGNARRLTSQ